MTLTVKSVVAASNAWQWTLDDMTTVEDAQYKIARLPDYFDPPLTVMEFRPSGPLGAAVSAVLDRARAFGLPKLRWEVRLDSPAELVAELTARGATRQLVLDVLACDLRNGAPTLPPASADVQIRWAAGFETARDASALRVTGFGGSLPPDDRIEANAAKDAATVPAGKGGLLVAYVGGVPSGSGGVTIVDGVARLWGGVVVPSARGQGIYRAVLEARMSYALAHGATMALVKGKVDTSGPILRRAGFTAYGQEPLYDIAL
ncbi:MAG: GNAT family N-acetyltransferase [Trebonia sp.]